MSLTITIISIASFFVGQVLVTRRCFIGFLIWAASNLMVALSEFANGNPSTASMFVIYSAANSYSLVSWWRCER